MLLHYTNCKQQRRTSSYLTINFVTTIPFMARQFCGPRPPYYRAFMITLRHTTANSTPLCELSARSGDLYVTTQATPKRQTNMSPVGFELLIPARVRPQTHGLDLAATGIGRDCLTFRHRASSI